MIYVEMMDWLVEFIGWNLSVGIYRLEFIGWNLSVGIYRCRAARGGLNFKIYDICLGV